MVRLGAVTLGFDDLPVFANTRTGMPMAMMADGIGFQTLCKPKLSHYRGVLKERRLRCEALTDRNLFEPGFSSLQISQAVTLF